MQGGYQAIGKGAAITRDSHTIHKCLETARLPGKDGLDAAKFLADYMDTLKRLVS